MPNFNPSANQLKIDHNILMTRDRSKLGGQIDPVENKILAGPNIGYIENEKYEVAHVSHQNIGFLQEKYSQYKNKDASKLRIDLIKILLGI
jgi:hypothetical protein